MARQPRTWPPPGLARLPELRRPRAGQPIPDQRRPSADRRSASRRRDDHRRHQDGAGVDGPPGRGRLRPVRRVPDRPHRGGRGRGREADDALRPGQGTGDGDGSRSEEVGHRAGATARRPRLAVAARLDQSHCGATLLGRSARLAGDRRARAGRAERLLPRGQPTTRWPAPATPGRRSSRFTPAAATPSRRTGSTTSTSRARTWASSSPTRWSRASPSPSRTSARTAGRPTTLLP